MAYPLLPMLSLTEEVREEVGEEEVGEERVKEEGVEEVVVVRVERPSVPRYAFVALCHHQ